MKSLAKAYKPKLAGFEDAQATRLTLLVLIFHLDPRSQPTKLGRLALQLGLGLKFGQAPPDVQGRGQCYFRLDPVPHD